MSLANNINPITGHFLECACDECDKYRERDQQRFEEEDEHCHLRELELMEADLHKREEKALEEYEAWIKSMEEEHK